MPDTSTIETKSLFASKTFWGAVIMMISSLLGFFDISLSEGEQDKIALMLADFAGFSLLIWGRIAAKKSIAVKKDVVPMLLLLVVLILPACALKSMQPHEQALTVTNETINLYEALHKEYLYLHAALPEKQAMLETAVAPALDMARVAIVAMGDATALWYRTKEKPAEWDGLKARAMYLLTDAGQILARVKGP